MNDGEVLQHSGLQPLDYAAVVFYLLLTFAIAVWFSRKQKSTEDFFVGGRRMPWFAVGLSILATLFSTISYLAVPGEVIKNGIGLFCGYLAVPLNFVVIMYFWVPFFMRLRLTSAYEYLELRFCRGMRIVGASLFVLLRLGWMSMVVFAASLALDRVKGDDFEFLPGPDLLWWVGVIGVVAAVYTALGGIEAVIWVDVLQCILLLIGVLLAIGYVALIDHTGPTDWIRETGMVTAKHTHPPVFSFDLTVRVTIVTAMINNFFWTTCTHGSDQVVLQRYFSTSSLSAARRSYLINLIVDLGMATLLALAGLALLSFYLKHATLVPDGKTAIDMADKLFPHFLGHQLPAGCAGLVVSAFLCDAIQTLESGVNAITAVVVQDFMTKSKAAPDDERANVRANAESGSSRLHAARVLSIVIALVVTGNAYAIAYLYEHFQLTIVDMMPKFFNMFVGPLAGIFFVGMFLPRCTTRSILPASGVGLCVAVVWSWWEFIFGTQSRPTFLLAIAVPWISTVGTAAVLGYLLESGKPHKGHDYTWIATVRRDQSR